MARPIRNIPTLFGNEAQSFIREAERVEANPGTIKVQRKRVIGTGTLVHSLGSMDLSL